MAAAGRGVWPNRSSTFLSPGFGAMLGITGTVDYGLG